MKNRALLSAIALCFLVAGCESKKEEPVKPKVADKVVPVPAPAPTPPPASAAQDAKPAGVAQVAGTQKAAAPAAMRGCKRGNCKITVTVQTSPGGDCTRIMKVPEHRGVWAGTPSNPQRDVPIEWNLATPDWQFDAKGVDFAGNGKFRNGVASNGKRTFTWTDVNDDTGQHNYAVNLVNPKTNKKCSADPSIVNGVLVED